MMQDPEASLAMRYIEEYLTEKGYTWDSLCQVAKEDARRLMAQASTYAALKVAEVAARAHLEHEIHGMVETQSTD